MTIEELYQQTTALMRDGKSGAAFKLLDEFITLQQYELDRLKSELAELKATPILPEWFVIAICDLLDSPYHEDDYGIGWKNRFEITRQPDGTWRLERAE